MNQKKNAFPRIENWSVSHFQKPPFNDIKDVTSASDLLDWPEVERISEVLRMENTDIRFAEQMDDPRYYEQIIFEDKCVPTRPRNWHDFYNACIWRLFPKTKHALNRIHMFEISEFGLTPRTSRRDRVTHFDECGVVLAFSDPHVMKALTEHQWQYAFIEERSAWGSSVNAYLFGHANYEMLMNPHIGLTGKWLGVEVGTSFWDWPLKEQYKFLDQELERYAGEAKSFTRKNQLHPLPLLGIPGWWRENERPEFYDNVDYFRPKRKSTTRR